MLIEACPSVFDVVAQTIFHRPLMPIQLQNMFSLNIFVNLTLMIRIKIHKVGNSRVDLALLPSSFQLTLLSDNLRMTLRTQNTDSQNRCQAFTFISIAVTFDIEACFDTTLEEADLGSANRIKCLLHRFFA